jgi:hypothetical protein
MRFFLSSLSIVFIFLLGNNSYATEGEFSECWGVVNDEALSFFAGYMDFSELKSGPQKHSIQVDGRDAVIEVAYSKTVKETMTEPTRGSGWNDIVKSTTVLDGTLDFGSQPQEMNLVCRFHYRGRY